MVQALPMDDEYYMKQALKEARKAFEAEEIPIGALIVIKDTIIARGHNQVEKLNDSTAHAEMIALTSAFGSLGTKYLPDASIFITIEPCLMCAGALYWSKIGRVVFGAGDSKNGYSRFCSTHALQQNNGLPFHPKTTLLNGLLQEECADLMKMFFQARR
ncbi:MAG: nucleoside deaminase [Chitinophagaceae bacterium]